jgi:cold-inducible RNA-binding protein
MSRTLFVDGLSADTTEADLQRRFALFGRITNAMIIRDDDDGEPCGFAYVSFADDRAAGTALTWLNGTELGDATLKIFEADDLQLAGSDASRWSPSASAGY